MKGSEFVFDCVDLLCYDLHRIRLNRGRPYLDSSKWLKKITKNVKNNDVFSICFNCCIKLS